MNNNCNIIRDLLPLYCDKICSEETRVMVEEHLADCQECSTILMHMQSNNLETEDARQREVKKTDVLKKIKKSILRKKVLTAVIAVISTIVIITGLYSAAALIESPVKYAEGLVRVNPASNGAIDVFYQGTNYACVYGMEKEITVEGQKQRIAYIYYTNSLWSKHFEKKHIPGTLRFSMDSSIIVEDGENSKIDAVYYLIGNYRKLNAMSEKEFSKYKDDAVLIWER